jgi:glutamate synthase domain-containing protein 2
MLCLSCIIALITYPITLPHTHSHHIKIICSGKVVSGFSVVRNLSLGADVCNSARAMLFALGCVQALKCNTNRCPTGITTQDPELMKGLDVNSKKVRVMQVGSFPAQSVVSNV